MKLLFNQDEAVAQWVAERIPYVGQGRGFGSCSAIGVVDEQGRPLGGIVYHNYQDRFKNIELSFASCTPRWLTREILCAFLRYPFAQLGCNRVTAVTPRRATSARKFLDDFGFKREGVVRFGFGDDHAIISGLLAREWAAHRYNRDLKEPARLAA